MVTTLHVATVETYCQGHSVINIVTVTTGHDEALCECQKGAL